MIDLEPQHIAEVRQILKRSVPDCKVLAFGSRTRGSSRKNSDLDLMLFCDSAIDQRVIERLKDAFSLSDLPFLVDVIDGREMDGALREAFLRDSVVIQEPEQ